MHAFIVRGLLIGVFCIPAVAAAADPYDTCKDLPEKAIIHCLRMVYEMNTGERSSPAPSGRSIFSDVMSKKSLPSDSVAPPSSEALTPYEQRRVEEQAAKTLSEDRVAQRAIEDLKYQRLHEEQRAQERQYREEDREDRREAARMQALGMFLGSRPFSWQQPMPTYQPPPPIQYAPVYQAPPVRPPVNCTANTVGQYTYTNCN
jgi:hypothetical protein